MSAEEVDTVIAGLGISLPKDVRDFLIAHQGTRPIENDHPEQCICLFMPLKMPGDHEEITIPEEMRNLHEALELSTFDWLPIAADPGGNLTCIKLNDPGAGGVYFLDHHSFGDEDFARFVSPSITAYLDALVSGDHYEL